MHMFLNPLLIYVACILSYIFVNASYLLKVFKILTTFLLSEIRNRRKYHVSDQKNFQKLNCSWYL